MKATYQRLQSRRQAGEISGFTLIELLIVIVVLGILAAVVIFALGGITGKSQAAACEADGATVSTAISAFNAQNPGVTVTSALLTGTTDGGPYIQSWPNATSYQFSFVGTTLSVQKVVSGTPTGTVVTYFGPKACTNAQTDTPPGIGLG